MEEIDYCSENLIISSFYDCYPFDLYHNPNSLVFFLYL